MVVKNPPDAARLVAVGQEEILVAPGLVFGVPVRVVGVAGGLEGGVEADRVRRLLAALFVEDRGQVGALQVWMAEDDHQGRGDDDAHPGHELCPMAGDKAAGRGAGIS